MKRFASIALIIIIGGLGVLFISLKTLQPQVCGVKDFEPFCGTTNLSENAYEGKQIFNANCAACHKLDRDMTGPALREIGKKYDTLTIIKFLHGNKTLIKSKGYNNVCVNFPNLTYEEASNLLKYTQ
ncbi:c-type cytochrome [Winogradskyella algicola]|uniref:c-type cytochrome n=1 Tax=Winogradskyella algicola TaxID=2575815 RepID=UPI00110946BD|nr:cytochrome c [Winogradskyella algicola]